MSTAEKVWIRVAEYLGDRDPADPEDEETFCVSADDLQKAITFGVECEAPLNHAASDLLAALKAVVAIADRKTDVFDAAHAAIAKAEGRDDG